MAMAEYIERKSLMENIHETVLFTVRENEKMPTAQMRGANKVIDRILRAPTADVVEIPKSGIGDLSDGYHTFNELYHHRAILFSLICNLMPDKAWKSKLHDTGDMYDGMFICGIETPQGQATYHYDIDPYWDMFKVKELEKAPKWDGHTPQDAIERLSTMAADVVEVRRGKWLSTYEYALKVGIGDEDQLEHLKKDKTFLYCQYCDQCVKGFFNYCPNCGAKMDGKEKDNGNEYSGAVGADAAAGDH